MFTLDLNKVQRVPVPESVKKALREVLGEHRVLDDDMDRMLYYT